MPATILSTSHVIIQYSQQPYKKGISTPTFNWHIALNNLPNWWCLDRANGGCVLFKSGRCLFSVLCITAREDTIQVCRGKSFLNKWLLSLHARLSLANCHFPVSGKVQRGRGRQAAFSLPATFHFETLQTYTKTLKKMLMEPRNFHLDFSIVDILTCLFYLSLHN